MISRLTAMYFLLFGLFIFSCGADKPREESKDDMAPFAKDEKFKNAHETPVPIELEEKGGMMTFKTKDGKPGSAYAIIADENSKKALFVIHEWWGLNDHIKQEADRLFGALDGVNVYALDLYDGNVATTREDAGKMMGAVKEDRLNTIINGALAHVGKDAKIGTIGWCFGGGWSLKSSILAGDQGAGCVIYYGMPVLEPAKLAPIKSDVLGLFAEKDGWITPEIVTKFETAMKAIGKSVKTKQFDAEHAFANPSSPRYHEAAAQEANEMALTFLKEKL